MDRVTVSSPLLVETRYRSDAIPGKLLLLYRSVLLCSDEWDEDGQRAA